MTFAPQGSVLVIVPTYNECDNIEPITARTLNAVPSAHLLIVDDDSPDGTGAIADRLALADSRIRRASHQGRVGRRICRWLRMGAGTRLRRSGGDGR